MMVQTITNQNENENKTSATQCTTALHEMYTSTALGQSVLIALTSWN